MVRRIGCRDASTRRHPKIAAFIVVEHAQMCGPLRALQSDDYLTCYQGRRHVRRDAGRVEADCRADLPDTTPHAMRHSFTSVADNLDITEFATRAVLGTPPARWRPLRPPSRDRTVS